MTHVNCRHIDFDNLQLSTGCNKARAYSQSKLANVLFAYEFNRRYCHHGVYANALEPGIVASNILREANWFIRVVGTRVMRLIGKSPEQGAYALSSQPAAAGGCRALLTCAQLHIGLCRQPSLAGARGRKILRARPALRGRLLAKKPFFSVLPVRPSDSGLRTARRPSHLPSATMSLSPPGCGTRAPSWLTSRGASVCPRSSSALFSALLTYRCQATWILALSSARPRSLAARSTGVPCRVRPRPSTRILSLTHSVTSVIFLVLAFLAVLIGLYMW